MYTLTYCQFVNTPPMMSLPVKGISLILGNDLAGNQVMTDPCVCSMSCLSIEAEESELQRSCVFFLHVQSYKPWLRRMQRVHETL